MNIFLQSIFHLFLCHALYEWMILMLNNSENWVLEWLNEPYLLRIIDEPRSLFDSPYCAHLIDECRLFPLRSDHIDLSTLDESFIDLLLWKPSAALNHKFLKMIPFLSELIVFLSCKSSHGIGLFDCFFVHLSFLHVPVHVIFCHRLHDWLSPFHVFLFGFNFGNEQSAHPSID